MSEDMFCHIFGIIRTMLLCNEKIALYTAPEKEMEYAMFVSIMHMWYCPLFLSLDLH